MRRSKTGFSLIELMITVAIVAILAAIAYPSYRQQVRRSNRTEAKTALLSAAQTLEKCFTINNGTYFGCIAPPPFVTLTPNGYYNISVLGGVPTADAFTVSAVATAKQGDDTDCQTFTVDQTGARTAKDGGGTDTTAKCWK